MTPITATISVSDDQDSQPEVRLVSITHNEASDAAPDVADASFGTDDRSFSLRAARLGRSRLGRVYKVVYSATDWLGNTSFAKAYITVPHDWRKGELTGN